jgi:Aspartyl protease
MSLLRRTPLAYPMALGAALAVLACSCGSAGTAATTTTIVAKKIVIGLPQFTLPPASAGCGGATQTPAGATSIPVTVSADGTQVAALANVCVDGQGPFPFVIDTGAAGSVIDTTLAKHLHLLRVGTPQEFAGVGCTASSVGVKVDTWSVGGLSLSSQTLSSASVPGFGGPREPDGLVGSDVWSRFSAMRLDFTHQTIEVPGEEGPAPTTPVITKEPGSTPVPPSLVSGTVGTVAPMRVEEVEGQVLITTTVRFGSHRALQFVPDTGDSQSVVNRSTSRSLGLTPSNVAARQTTVCSTITVPLVHSGRWSASGAVLTPQLIGSTNLGVVSAGGLNGLLGADQMSRFGSVIFDYGGGRLVLGAG